MQQSVFSILFTSLFFFRNAEASFVSSIFPKTPGSIGSIHAYSSASSETSSTTLSMMLGDQGAPEKQVIFLRHSITHMNEYLGRSLRFGAPGFSDVFPDEERQNYLDTPLSPRGIQLVKQTLTSQPPRWTNGIDMVVVSPLQRALQTFDLGLGPHLPLRDNPKLDGIQVVAHPDAAERLYLISDVGRPISQLSQQFPYVDFSEMALDDKWWWTPEKSQQSYVEWRPTGQGQKYACPGEPQQDFDARMTRLHQWLEDRPEQLILVVCHHGVIEWMLDMDFDNCQWRQVAFSNIRPKSLIKTG